MENTRFMMPYKTGVVSEKGPDDMYPPTKMDFTVGEVQARYEDVMGPLSLFAPYPHEDAPHQETVQLDRPVTPINEEVKTQPLTFGALAKLVRRRISAQRDVQHMTVEDQQALGAVIMGEVNGIWPDFRLQVDDPFMSAEQNKELSRRITVHIVTVCQELFQHYIQKAQVLNKKGIFSGPANMSRLKAQLALDANEYLNVLAIRRHILNDMKHRHDDDSDDETKPAPPKISHQAFLEAARPDTGSRRKKLLSTAEHIRQMKQQMPALETHKLLGILSDLPQVSSSPASSSVPSQQRDSHSTRSPSTVGSTEGVPIRKCESVPLLQVGETLLEELSIDQSELNKGRQTSASTDVIPYSSTSARKPEESTSISEASAAREDLRQLVASPKETQLDKKEGEDLPPLIQALTCSAKHDGKKEELQQQMKKLKEQEERLLEQQKVEIREPTHPQPATVSTKLPNQFMARTCDIRVSERVCMSSLTLAKHSTVYNDLIDEIDPVTVKNMDSNLFLGDEISEVYKEIMKTVPSDHLHLENDDIVEPTADAVNLTGVLASSTLSRKKADRIINKKLNKSDDPPWGQQDHRGWAKTPVSPPKDTKGRPQFEPQAPPNADYMGGMEQAGQPMMAEVASRSYASWLSWWKNTINSDDYMKYLSTQETDYMGVIFHFYDSDEEGPDEDETTTGDNTMSRHTGLSGRIEERRPGGVKSAEDEKKTELWKQKTEFKEGMWNVNSVLLGGLGKDPTPEVEPPVKIVVPDESLKVRTPRKTTVISRRSQRSAMDDLDRDSKNRTRLSDNTGSLSVNRTGTAESDSNTDGEVTEEKIPQEQNLATQDRLEKVWAMLKMPDGKRLDMAIKYSSDQYFSTLEQAISSWEEVTNMIQKREIILAKLENFERYASDPNRFFEKGYRGSSVARLEEAKTRSTYYSRIDQLEKDIVKQLDYMENNFGDMVTYEGRPYRDKMQWDRTEMLYWLQEERKQQVISYESHTRKSSSSISHLQPITPSTVAI